MLVVMVSEDQSRTWSLSLYFGVKHQVPHDHYSTTFMVFSVTYLILRHILGYTNDPQLHH